MRKLSFFLFILLVTITSGNDSLRKEALQYGLSPVPKDYESLLQVLGETREDISKEKIRLGKRLFFEKKLSLNADISCASCHDLKEGGIDGEITAIGHKDQENPFHLNTPTVLNTALSSKLFWNGRSATLEDQAKGPIIASFEMASSPTLIESRLNKEEHYLAEFGQVYGEGKITFDYVVDAISTYERTLITRGRYDDFLEGDTSALNSDEQDGLRLFIEKGCIGCHDGMGLGGRELRKFPIMRHPIWSLRDLKKIKSLREEYNGFMHMLGMEEGAQSLIQFADDGSRYDYLVEMLGKEDVRLLRDGYFDEYKDDEAYTAMVTRGCYECHEKNTYRVSRETLAVKAYPFENKGSFLGQGRQTRYFRVPLLRNIVSTEPYFHNGGIERLEDAIKLMIKHQLRTRLTDDEVKKMVEFFKAVDGNLVDYGFDLKEQ